MIRTGIVTLLLPFCALAQLAPPNNSGVSMGHVHINARSPEAQHRFWTILGATPVKSLGSNEVYKVKNGLILVRKQDPTSGSEASTVHHVGFVVKDLQRVLAGCLAVGLRVLTPADVVAKTHKANVMGPDEINVELIGDPGLSVPIATHHIHFYNSPVDATKAWYVKTFGAVAGKRDSFEAADLPGVNLTFSAAKEQKPLPTKGRAFDHIGFEVRNLEAFCKRLEAAGVKFDRPYTKMPDLGLSLAFLTDPWGTYIELTEGLSGW